MMLPLRAEHGQDVLLCCCGSGRPGQHLSFSFPGPLEAARVWERERELRRAASGTQVCPFILTAGTLGNSRGKFHFYSSGTWGLCYYIIYLFKSSVRLLLSPPPRAAQPALKQK